MPLRGVVVMLACAPFLAQVFTSASDCGWRRYQCTSGQCIAAQYLCDGEKECADGSDESEAACGRTPTTQLPVGNVVTVKVRRGNEHEDVNFHICSSAACSSLSLAGHSPKKSLRYIAYVKNNAQGDHGQKHHETFQKDPNGWTSFPEGELVFEVQHRPNELAVWLAGHPDKAAVVPVQEPSDKLLVKHNYWSVSMPVEFIGNKAACSDTEFRCLDGDCIDSVRRCDGQKHCGDNSDEDVKLCDGAPSTVLPKGNVVTVGVYRKQFHGDVEFHLCTSSDCSVLRVAGNDAASNLAYTAIVKANARGGNGTNYAQTFEKDAVSWRWFPEGEVEFEAQHRPSELAVWLRGHPDKAAAVPVEEKKYMLLRVLPRHRRTDMPVTFEGNAPACGDSQFRCGDGECVAAALRCDGRRDCVDGSDEDDILAMCQWVAAPASTNCTFRHYQCTSGQCIDSDLRCDGRKQCDDGSDESDSACGRPTTTQLLVGNVVTVKVQKKKVQGNVRINLCSSTACSGLSIGGSSANKSLAYVAYVRSNERGDFGRKHHQMFENDFKGWTSFPEGELVFEVQHRPNELAVWLAGHPDKAAVVPVQEPSDKLLVTPYLRSYVMPVEFIGNKAECSDTEFRCLDGDCIDSVRRCDGHKHCGDNSDEDVKLCDGAIVGCGRGGPGPATLVQNGNKTSIESVPWHAGIFVEANGRLQNVCGGSLVSPCIVVTAAHCLLQGKIFVALGKFLSGWHSESGEDVHKTEVKRIIKHPHYLGYISKLVSDIAVLELKNCSPISKKISPICIDKNVKPVLSADVKVAGWGNETTVLTDLASVTLRQLTFDDCLALMTKNGPHVAYVTLDKFCAQRKRGTPESGLLQGDSGGGAVVMQHGSWFLAGVVSARLKDGDDRDIYALTDVSHLSSRRPSCGSSAKRCRSGIPSWRRCSAWGPPRGVNHCAFWCTQCASEEEPGHDRNMLSGFKLSNQKPLFNQPA
ncbi:uncharacterized protein LOC117647989 isoform X2 [Thrips palmi]|uniref:Uncharacterized protein LOC117647989 isoform X2 n=1 Tax=Thrips palmi TaxID=161013 RepID=A0A6P8ZQI6_THRPL|nr:uncharacterized protein LOC117647989 isoform X2 [Thrips palmi]